MRGIGTTGVSVSRLDYAWDTPPLNVTPVSSFFPTNERAHAGVRESSPRQASASTIPGHTSSGLPGVGSVPASCIDRWSLQSQVREETPVVPIGDSRMHSTFRSDYSWKQPEISTPIKTGPCNSHIAPFHSCATTFNAPATIQQAQVRDTLNIRNSFDGSNTLSAAGLSSSQSDYRWKQPEMYYFSGKGRAATPFDASTTHKREFSPPREKSNDLQEPATKGRDMFQSALRLNYDGSNKTSLADLSSSRSDYSWKKPEVLTPVKAYQYTPNTAPFDASTTHKREFSPPREKSNGLQEPAPAGRNMVLSPRRLNYDGKGTAGYASTSYYRADYPWIVPGLDDVKVCNCYSHCRITDNFLIFDIFNLCLDMVLHVLIGR